MASAGFEIVQVACASLSLNLVHKLPRQLTTGMQWSGWLRVRNRHRGVYERERMPMRAASTSAAASAAAATSARPRVAL